MKQRAVWSTVNQLFLLLFLSHIFLSKLSSSPRVVYPLLHSLHVVLLHRHALQKLIEPVHDVLQPFDAVPRRART